jgi:uncharacterized membrane protein YdjX (TVP38/TMEM64 family)
VTNRAKTIAILLAFLVLLLVWEGWVLVNAEQGDTISSVIATAAERWPVIPFLAGLLCGHFFWPMKDHPPAE